MYVFLCFVVSVHFMYLFPFSFSIGLIVAPSHKSMRHEAVRAWLDTMSGGREEKQVRQLILVLYTSVHGNTIEHLTLLQSLLNIDCMLKRNMQTQVNATACWSGETLFGVIAIILQHNPNILTNACILHVSLSVLLKLIQIIKCN